MSINSAPPSWSATFTRLHDVIFPSVLEVPSTAKPLKLGILGAAKIAPAAVIKPAKLMPDKVTVYSVAARDPARAQAFAKKHGIPKTHNTYEELINDPEIDVVYIPAPNGLHYEWSTKCVDAGKPVLLEKPCASNAEQARQLFEYAESKNVLVTEAYHWYFYPGRKKVQEIIGDVDSFGEVMRFEGSLSARLKGVETDIRSSFDLAGGALMDTGCYPISWMRTMMSEEPVSAKKLTCLTYDKDPRIDYFTQLEYSFASNPDKKGIIHTGLKTPFTELYKIGVLPFMKITGTKKELTYTLPVYGNFYHDIAVKDLETGKVEHFKAYVQGREAWNTYAFQLDAFYNAVTQGKAEELVSKEFSIKTMEAIDMGYVGLGLPLRE
ncbi:hypothetical protein BZA70DRAFT_287608 [Myxozyma melibiosi]|uniref:D-xylose 1-dehydrogenase (NADP(+), D-xylono-1,5-lactone-forming) n=1 Tax=Myxozyma melibiosi TaxID=54550 RepID=A0ABR1FEL9_9ASCO